MILSRKRGPWAKSAEPRNSSNTSDVVLLTYLHYFLEIGTAKLRFLKGYFKGAKYLQP